MQAVTLLLLQIIAVAFAQPQSCSVEGDVQLALFNDNDPYAGVVKICHNGVWGTICTANNLNSSWHLKNAHMACWQGVPTSSGALNTIILGTLPQKYQVPQSVPIHYRDISCDGTENTLLDCSPSTDTTGCTHDYDAAVVCRQAPKNNDVRLVGSKTDGQGAVEMFVTSYGWIRLCPGAFDLSGVCSKLGYTSTAYQTFSIANNRDSLVKLSLITVCTVQYRYYSYSYYSSYYQYSSYHQGIESYQSCTTEYTTSCNYATNVYAGVVCSTTATEGSVRLTGGSDPAIGNVEVFYNGIWGAVCSTGWNDNAGRVVCAQLGYDPYDNYFSTRPGGSYSGQNYLKPIWFNNVSSCSYPTTKKITECMYTPPIGYGPGCSSDTVATLQCTYVLTGGAIAGIVIGVLLFVIICAVLFCIIFCYCYNTGAYKSMNCSVGRSFKRSSPPTPVRYSEQPSIPISPVSDIPSNIPERMPDPISPVFIPPPTSMPVPAIPMTDPFYENGRFEKYHAEPEKREFVMNDAPPAYDDGITSYPTAL